MSARLKLTKLLMKSPGKLKKSPQVIEASKKSKWNILRGDTVQIIKRSHPEYGKKGIVTKVDRSTDRVTIEGVNVGPKRYPAIPERGIKGRVIQRERPVHYSTVNLVDPVTGLPTRVFRKYLEDGSKVRVSKKSGAIIPRPDVLSERRRPLNSTVTESCTNSDEDVWEFTYVPPADEEEGEVSA
uniref:Large ribosomal subunit protein uL24 C-terminal domain-containing protein n=1 Tax=Ditylum brightwellii TaxID=49249 RepID=A0A6U3V9H2_9STRA|mmetsp:Transcript_19094/g.28519  ORF Transcript_19094/g.28519 Transcript_19094/m.28519 type:complete len:184 (+) Transcript_19094:198-749(+)